MISKKQFLENGGNRLKRLNKSFLGCATMQGPKELSIGIRETGHYLLFKKAREIGKNLLCTLSITIIV